MAATQQQRDPTQTQELTRLISSSHNISIYPTDEHILSLVHARFRHDLPFTRVSPSESTLLVVNPFKTLKTANEQSAQDYKSKCYDSLDGDARAVQPHPFELAARAYMFMRRRNEHQAIVFRGVTGSGKSFSHHLLLSQLLRLSSQSKKDHKLSEQIRALQLVLHSFGDAKMAPTASASKHTTYLELHFNSQTGRIAGAKALAFALDKSRLGWGGRLRHEERTYHVFYQLLAGASMDERENLGLEDASEYAMLSSSGTFRLPGGSGGGMVNSDDAAAFEELKDALRLLGFKSKSLHGIWTLLAALLMLGNIKFVDGWTSGAHSGGLRKEEEDGNATVANPQTLERAARLLGIDPTELESALTRKTDYVRKEVVSAVLDSKGAERQRDKIIADLYTVLFTYVVESANRRVVPVPTGDNQPPETTQIVLLDQPGFQTRASPNGSSISSLATTTTAGPLISSALGTNTFDEFTANYQDELVHSFVLRQGFDSGVGRNARAAEDGAHVPPVNIVDNSACVELLRGSVVDGRDIKVGKKPGGMLGMMGRASKDLRHGKAQPGAALDEELVRELQNSFAASTSFVANPLGVSSPFVTNNAAPLSMFGVNHWAGNVAYEARDFVDRDCDRLDPIIVQLVRRSDDAFLAKLFSGPSLCTETHTKDPSIVVRAQASVRPLREPTPFYVDEFPEGEFWGLEKDKAYPLTAQIDSVLASLLARLERTHVNVWSVVCIRPNESGSPNSFDKRRVRHQIRALGLVDLVVKRAVEWTGDWTINEFLQKIGQSDAGADPEAVRDWAREVGWGEGVHYSLGNTRVWVSWDAWKDVEDRSRAAEEAMGRSPAEDDYEESVARDDNTTTHHDSSAWGRPSTNVFGDSQENLYATGPVTPTYPPTNSQHHHTPSESWTPAGDWDNGRPGSPGEQTPAAGTREGGVPGAPGGNGYMNLGSSNFLPTQPASNKATKPVEVIPTSRTRRIWVNFVWMCTWWIPSFLLSWIGRMKRPDVQMAWREKVTICMLIFLMCGLVIFAVIFFGVLLCPQFNFAWTLGEVQGHTADNDFWVAVRGNVYDISTFWKGDHSVPSNPMTEDVTITFAGTDMSNYFPPPLEIACAGLVTSDRLEMRYANASTTPIPLTAVHTSGALQPLPGTDLNNPRWYTESFLPRMKEYRKGPVVWDVRGLAGAVNDERIVAVYEGRIYDLSDYIKTLNDNNGGGGYDYLNDDIVQLFRQQTGQDITKAMDKTFAAMESDKVDAHKFCLDNVFFLGITDFRETARCQVPNYLILAFSAVIGLTILVKFFAALQLTGKRTPELLDKFIICQVPCYTEGEESLRRTIDSLAALKYDDKRKLLFLICDGNIVGSGNDRPTPRITLDILGVDPSLDPEPLMFRSIGEGSKQLNYGKVYSGLYEFEGHVVPYIVIVKVGRPSERSRPGNRGKRDSQILLLHYLNRVHFDAPMYPLELEIYHQMRNVIGIDPAFYEYIFMVDADTTVTPDSLNRLVAVTSDDSAVIAVCGETKLDNEEGSWWTMIQVYEYYISHHLAKAFESLFGSVTCLPGCFSMYRIRTADKGRPLIISNRILDDYSECNVDTLHKKNLFSLGEDRYLTTLMMKHFPTFKMKFTPDAIAHTVAPDKWSVLLSQRRRWINSTIHNLCEVVGLGELCGFCCFSMRFIVFVDLLGTIILPATAVYLVYLIVQIATSKAAIPIIALIMIAAVYGLQAIIFLLKREFMLIGWMVIYILAYPVYSFFLPIYSFWRMDDFSWGNTRLVVGEGKDKKVMYQEEETFDESMIPLKKFSEYEAEAFDGASRHSPGGGSQAPSRPDSRARSRAPYGTQHDSASVAGGDYYRDTNVMHSNASHSNLRAASRAPSAAGHVAPLGSGSVYGGSMPQMPIMPFAPAPGSVAGSDYGGTPMMPMAPFAMGGMGMGMAGSAYGGSMYGGMGGMMPGAPRNSVATNLNMFSGMPAAPPSIGGHARPMSTFSMATSINPFANAPSQSTDPTDEELLHVLRVYLSTQDLMTVTKKTAREAVTARFPRADLSSRKEFLNASIDQILSEA